MVGQAYKGVFITRYEAVRNFASATVFFVSVIFNREIYAFVSGKSVEQILTQRSYTMIVTYGSLLYFAFLLFWIIDVYSSIKHYKKTQRNLKILQEEQKTHQENLH